MAPRESNDCYAQEYLVADHGLPHDLTIVDNEAEGNISIDQITETEQDQPEANPLPSTEDIADDEQDEITPMANNQALTGLHDNDDFYSVDSASDITPMDTSGHHTLHHHHHSSPPLSNFVTPPHHHRHHQYHHHFSSPPPSTNPISPPPSLTASSVSSSSLSYHTPSPFLSPTPSHSFQSDNYPSLEHTVSFADDLSSPPTPPPYHPTPLSLTFSPLTTILDLKYFAERVSFETVIQSLTTPRLVTLGARMLADYARLSHHRLTIASSPPVWGFLVSTLSDGTATSDAREYSAETMRCVTASEESDEYLMNGGGVLVLLARCARGEGGVSGLTSLHACVAMMNLSCGDGNKRRMGGEGEVLRSLSVVMRRGGEGKYKEAARLKATTCVKNLSNADENHGVLVGCEGLVEGLGVSLKEGDDGTKINACLALMNLSIYDEHKHCLFMANGVMDALVTVVRHGVNDNVTITACSTLSNMAIGYDNKVPMFQYPGFVELILEIVRGEGKDKGSKVRNKACSILWSFAAEMKNQVPMVQRNDILPPLLNIISHSPRSEACNKCIATLALLAESPPNAIPLLHTGALGPVISILNIVGPDPARWKDNTASWCISFLMNLSQNDDAIPILRDGGVIELLTPLVTLDNYQSLKATMTVLYLCPYDDFDATHDLIRNTEKVIPKVISLLKNTLAGKGGVGYKYGVFTLRSSVGCIAKLASGPDFVKEIVATKMVYEYLMRVVCDFCVEGGKRGGIVGGGKDDVLSARSAIQALNHLTGYLIPVSGRRELPFGKDTERKLLTILSCFDSCKHKGITREDKKLARDVRLMVMEGCGTTRLKRSVTTDDWAHRQDVTNNMPAFASNVAVVQSKPGLVYSEMEIIPIDETNPQVIHQQQLQQLHQQQQVRTFLLPDENGRRFVVPTDPSGGRTFYDNRVWCYRRGRYCEGDELPDPDYQWSMQLQRAYVAALRNYEKTKSANQR